MESNKNDINNGGDERLPENWSMRKVFRTRDEHQQLRGNERKRTFNELANDVDQPADEDQQHEPLENYSKKNRGGQRGNDALENHHLESLSREELIQLVQKQNEALKRLETTAEKSAKQAEEFSQRNIQLEQKNVKVQKELHQKMGEIVKMHKEVEEKSKEVAQKAKEIDELLMQLKESSHQQQHLKPSEQQEEMKIQLSLETWFDWLGFVPRPRLGQIVPKIGDRRFALIVQKFLHKYGEITIDHIKIVAPYDEDPSGPHPRVRARQNDSRLRFKMAEAQIPANIKNFDNFKLSYFDQAVLTFMQKFQQNGLLENVNMWFNKQTKDIVQPVLRHLLPLINGIGSITMWDSAQFVDFYDAANSKEIYEMNMKMMEETRILSVSYDRKNLHPNKIDLYCRWLYQPARVDRKPRVLILGRLDVDHLPISLFIDRLKQDFLIATNPIYFVIRILLPKAYKPQEGICLDNEKTNERLLTKMEEAQREKIALMVSRYSLASTNNLIVGKEIYQKRIYLSKDLKVVPI